MLHASAVLITSVMRNFENYLVLLFYKLFVT